jgi:hypothetical protein
MKLAVGSRGFKVFNLGKLEKGAEIVRTLLII